MKIDSVIVKPVLTEKATQSAAQKIYTFEVNRKANKNQVKEALGAMYGVKVGGVRMTIRKGKTRRVGRRMITKALAEKKIAIVKVTEGTINVFPQA